MNDRSCNTANAWTCRQPVQPASSPEVLPMQTQAHLFLPGLVQDYLGQHALPTTKELAVVFVDIADSTSTLLHQSPAYALAMVQLFSALVTDIALAHCGDVKDYEGDGALLYFASLRQATQAALAIRDALLAEQRTGALTVHARISLNVGEVTIGVIGSAHRRAVALLGPSVHLAARLLKEVTPGGIIATQVVVERLQHEAPLLAQDFQLRGTCMTVRGFEEQCVTAYHLPGDTVPFPDSEAVGTPCCGKATTTAPAHPISDKQQKAIQLFPSSLQPSAFSLPHSSPTPNSQPPTPSTFRFEGEYWTVVFHGAVARIRDTRGMQHLALLLKNPHAEFAALELAADHPDFTPNPLTEASLTDETRDAAAATVHITGLTDAGEVLDVQAKAAYRQRVHELQAELEEARSFNDGGRVEKLQDELEFITHELVDAVGLRSRTRRCASPQERARVNVTRAIRTAIARVTEVHPVLGHYLTHTIKTGTFCSYAPEPHVVLTWEF